MDDQRPDPPAIGDDDAGSGDEARLNVSPASPSDLEDDLPEFQPGEGPGPTPGE